MKKINIDFKEMPYAVEEAMNRLRINIKFCGKNTKKFRMNLVTRQRQLRIIIVTTQKQTPKQNHPVIVR